MTGLLERFVDFWDPLLLWYFGGLNFFYGVLFAFSVYETWKHWSLASRVRLTDRIDDESFPPVSLLVPAHDEEKVIVDSVRSLLVLDYPAYEVVVVNDASTDRTLDRLKESFELYEVPPAFPRQLETAPTRGYYRSRLHPALLVVDKAPGARRGKAGALNVALNASRYPYASVVDADTVLDPEALRRLARAFFISDARVAGTGGTIRVVNGVDVRDGRVTDPRVPRNPVAALQVPEYFRTFLFGRLGWNQLGGNLLISGAFGLYDKSLMMEVGGFREDSVTEDLELTVSLHRLLRERGVRYTLPFVPDPVAWTEVPERLDILGNQRERWHRGLLSSLFRHGRMLFNPRYGVTGLVTFPYYVFGEMLEPVVELIAYAVIVAGLVTGELSAEFLVLFLGLAFGYQMLLSMCGVWLEQLTFRVYRDPREYARLIGLCLLEPFGYRQLTVWWRLEAFWNFLRDLGSWGEQVRTGFREAEESV